MKKVLLFALTIVLIFSLTACNLPIGQGEDTESAVQTAVALNVALTQVAATLTAAVPVVQPTVASATAEPPTVTPTVTLTPQPSFTPTPEGVWLTVLENTNCRTGPGTIYEWVTLIAAGVQVEAVARNSVNDYYYVKNPNATSGYCWLWSKYSSITGNITILPVFTPQPTPTVATATPAADFEVSYVGIITCTLPDRAVKVKIENTGSITWQSLRIVVKDRTNSVTKTHESNKFTSYDGCAVGIEQTDLTPGESGFVTTIPGYFSYNITGHDLEGHGNPLFKGQFRRDLGH